MVDAWLADTRSSYDTDASGYAEQVRGLLDGRPCLRASLALFAELVMGPDEAVPGAIVFARSRD